MIDRLTKLSVLSLTTLAFAGCLGTAPVENDGTPAARYGAAVVLSGEELWDRSGSVLRVLRGRLASVRVTRGGQCPRIIMRGHTSIAGEENANVFIDGTPMLNTCVLATLAASAVKRIEVYPMGVTGRPGYSSSSDGLLLLFMRDGNPREALSMNQ